MFYVTPPNFTHPLLYLIFIPFIHAHEHPSVQFPCSPLQGLSPPAIHAVTSGPSPPVNHTQCIMRITHPLHIQGSSRESRTLAHSVSFTRIVARWPYGIQTGMDLRLSIELLFLFRSIPLLKINLLRATAGLELAPTSKVIRTGSAHNENDASPSAFGDKHRCL
jgi:hypothetical protein